MPSSARKQASGKAEGRADIVGPRRERNAAETRRRILRAAELEFSKKGYDGARLGQIARAAEVQQALIHHYFDDKEGLYRGVVEYGLGAMSLEGWDVLRRFAYPLDRARIPEVVEAFVDLMMWQAVTHSTVFSIVRHASATDGEDETRGMRPDALVRKIVREKTKPVFDAVVALIEDMREKGCIRQDVHARHLCVSALSMVLFTVQDEGMVRGIWDDVDLRSPEFLRERKEEIVATILARLLIRPADAPAPAAPDVLEPTRSA